MQADSGEVKVRPVKSMTGFGRGCRVLGGVEVVTEVRTVNHRFADVSLKLPRMYSAFEPRLRQIVSEHVSRGKVEAGVSRRGAAGSVMDVSLDYDLAERYHRSLVKIKEGLGLEGGINISDILTLKEVVVPQENEDAIEMELPLVEESLGEALAALDRMRDAEGAALWKDIEARLSVVKELVSQVRPLVQQVPAAARARLERRIQELTGGMELDEERLLQEVALIADRSDVTEELTRLESHVDQFRAIGKEGSPLGRKLDFLLQEFHRELNTLGSKSGSTDIASFVVNLKTEVERIREQTQNIE